MTHDDVTALVGAYGWAVIHSKNAFMYSYRQEETGARLNYYMTSGTFTIQESSGGIQVTRGVNSLGKLEDILIAYDKARG